MLKLSLKEQHELLIVKAFARRQAVALGHQPSKFELAYSRTAVSPAWMSVCDGCHMPIMVYADPLGIEAPMLDSTCDEQQEQEPQVIVASRETTPTLFALFDALRNEQAKRN